MNATTETTTTPDPRRIAAALAACEGIPTAQLEGMVAASGNGVLATAYDVCSDIWEEHAADLIGADQVESDIDGEAAGQTLLNLNVQLEQVVAWAREAQVLS